MSFFYAFADEEEAVTAGAMAPDEKSVNQPTEPGAIVVRRNGIELSNAVFDPETLEVITPAVMSAPLVILSPTIMVGCSSALVVPSNHVGFA